MSKTTKPVVCLLFVALATMLISCNDGTKQPVHYSNKSVTNTSSTKVEESSRTSKPMSISNDRKNTEVGNEISRICNTKWTFTDNHGTKFVLNISGIARDGKSAKAELVSNGNTDYATVEPYYTGFGSESEFKCYLFNESAHTDIFFPSSKNQFDHGFLGIMKWDYDNGYLYQDIDAFDSESPVDRLAIKKTK